MKKIIIIILVVFYTIATNGQSIDTLPCGTPDRDTTEFENLPWFGNNAYLENFLDSIGYPSGMNKNISGELNPSGTVGINGIVGSERIKFHVPIKFWVYRNSAGVGGPTLQQLQKYIDDLNKYYNVDNNTLIGFYMRCEINYIDDNSHTNIESGLEASLLLQSHKERGCINIHIVNSLYDDILGELIRARFFGIDGIFLDQFTYSRPDLASTIAHEVGHYFELDHTHQYYNKGKCRKEPISRTRTFPFFNFAHLHVHPKVI